MIYIPVIHEHLITSQQGTNSCAASGTWWTGKLRDSEEGMKLLTSITGLGIYPERETDGDF